METDLDHEKRLTRLEQWAADHAEHASRRFDKNDSDHERLLEIVHQSDSKLETIERYILKREAFFMGGLFVIGGLAGFITTKWSWVWDKIHGP